MSGLWSLKETGINKAPRARAKIVRYIRVEESNSQ